MVSISKNTRTVLQIAPNQSYCVCGNGSLSPFTSIFKPVQEYGDLTIGFLTAIFAGIGQVKD